MANTIAKKGSEQFDGVRFEHGPVALAPDVDGRFDQEFIDQSLQRHCRGEWGLSDQLTQRRNERCLQQRGFCVESVHRSPKGGLLVVVTVFDGATSFVMGIPEN